MNTQFEEFKRSPEARAATQRKLLDSADSLLRIMNTFWVVGIVVMLAAVFCFVMSFVCASEQVWLWRLGVVGCGTVVLLSNIVFVYAHKKTQRRIDVLKMIQKDLERS